MNLINAGTYSIGHEATKEPKPSHAQKTRAKCATQSEFNKCSNILTSVMRKQKAKFKPSHAVKTRAKRATQNEFNKLD